MNISVDNIKCGGCASTISKKLKGAFATDKITVDIEKGIISIDTDEDKRDEVVATLLTLGYPQSGALQGFDATKAKAKSFVSCAIGKINQ